MCVVCILLLVMSCFHRSFGYITLRCHRWRPFSSLTLALYTPAACSASNAIQLHMYLQDHYACWLNRIQFFTLVNTNMSSLGVVGVKIIAGTIFQQGILRYHFYIHSLNSMHICQKNVNDSMSTMFTINILISMPTSAARRAKEIAIYLYQALVKSWNDL